MTNYQIGRLYENSTRGQTQYQLVDDLLGTFVGCRAVNIVSYTTGTVHYAIAINDLNGQLLQQQIEHAIENDYVTEALIASNEQPAAIIVTTPLPSDKIQRYLSTCLLI